MLLINNLFTSIFCYFSLYYVLLGIRTTRRISLQLLSSKLCGFLEYVPRIHFRSLQRLHYKSLYSFDYEDPEDTTGFSPSSRNRKTYYFILFGPLALCNSSNDVTVRFYNYDDRDGTLTIWKSVYKVFVEEEDADYETLTSFSSTNSLTIADRQLTPDGLEYAPFGIANMSTLRRTFFNDYLAAARSKTEFFVKVFLHHPNTATFNNHVYEADEEVFVKYNLADHLIL